VGKEMFAVTPDGENHTLLTTDETPEPITGDFVEIDSQLFQVEKRVFVWNKAKMVIYLKKLD
jgi:hypothetical protein